MIRLLLTALLLITTSSMAANKSQAASLSAEQAAKPEIKNFTGIIKSRNRSASEVVYYIELENGEKIHISSNCDAKELKKHADKKVKIKTRLREKSDYPNDFIRQIYSFELIENDF
jgi:hypothetical protein